MPNVIGDIAGNYKTLRALLKKMPDDEPISVGDMVDRGPSSKEVIDFFMNHGRAILGNHEHLMLDAHNDPRLTYYDSRVWEMNGGGATLNSFGGSVPHKVLEWVERLPKYIQLNGVFVSHAFINPHHSLEEVLDLGSSSYDYYKCDSCIIWNRDPPIRRDDLGFQLAGHNSQFGLKYWSDNKGDFAIGLDTSRQKVLTGIHIPSMKIYQQEYVD